MSSNFVSPLVHQIGRFGNYFIFTDKATQNPVIVKPQKTKLTKKNNPSKIIFKKYSNE